MYITPVSEYSHEKEFLLDKNQKWKIIGHKVVKTTIIDQVIILILFINLNVQQSIIFGR